jgi:ubiquinone/menaquinone biosynthesis C-methylase UbiE
MNDSPEQIRKHYETGDGNSAAVAQILRTLEELGEEALTAAALAPLDQFHARGLPATKELAELAGLVSGMKVLDAGSGLGGPSRYIAATYGCHVTGVDITPSFVEIASSLAKRTGVGHLVDYQVGDLRDLHFQDHYFDLIWTQHVLMNIGDRETVYREFRRVLSPSGRLVFFDLFAPDEKPELKFPVPWATSPEMSFLLTKTETIRDLNAAGFVHGEWNDVSDQTRAILVAGQAPPPAPAGTPPALALPALMGPRFREMLPNLQSAVREGRIRLVMGIYHPGEAGEGVRPQ